MKILYFIFFVLFIFTVSSMVPVELFGRFFLRSENEKNIPIPERLVYQILNETSSDITKNFNLSACGTIISMPEFNIKKLGLSFNSYQSLTEMEIRKLTINFAERLLKNITSKSEIQPFLAYKPFTIKNIDIYIFNCDSQGYSIKDPGVGVASISSGILTYCINDPIKIWGYKNQYEETYEQALQIIQEENNLKDPLQ